MSSHLKTKQSLGHHLAVVGFLASVEEDGVVAVSVLILVPGGETVTITRTFTKESSYLLRATGDFWLGRRVS